MNRREVRQLARELVEEHLDMSGEHQDWKFAFNNRARSMGLCHYRNKTIYISTAFLPNMSDEQVVDTLLHEIAHVLTPGCSHNAVWQAQAASIGAIPRTSADVESSKTYTWAMMLNDEMVKGYFRKPSQKVFDRIGREYVVGQREETLGKLSIVKL